MQPKSFEMLWKHYVPRDGAPRNVQGTLLRAIAKISHEVSINECANWGPELEESVDALRRELGAPDALPAAERAAALADLDTVNAKARAGAHAELPPVIARVKAVVVDWCNRRLAEQAREA